jgi:hypothetical protein
MTQAEFMRWAEFYRAQPFDDFHRFHRPAALVAGSFGGGDMQARLDWLQPPVEREHDDQNVFMQAVRVLTQKEG